MPSEHVRRIRRGLRWLKLRGLVLAVVFGCGLAAFLMGVSVSDRAGVPEADVMAKVYYTLGLFVLGGLDLGVPSGGPEVAQVMLWAVYFLAPLITASAVIEGVLRALQPHRWLLARLRDHVVIGGCGQLTMLYLERLRAGGSDRHVVVVERRTSTPNAQEARHRYRALVVQGDVTHDAMLEALRLPRARQVLLLTGDDFANLDAATKVDLLAPELTSRTVAHVSDIRTLRSVEKAHLPQACRLFNSHRIAAAHLVKTKVLEHFQRTEPRDVVVLAGFGRFNQTVLDELQQSAPGAFAAVFIIDLEAEQAAWIFQEQVGFAPDHQWEVLDGDLRDPRVWRRVEEAVDMEQTEPVLILASGDDAVNLRTALELKQRFPRAYVVARVVRASPFAERTAAQRGFEVIQVARLVQSSMPDGWFA